MLHYTALILITALLALRMATRLHRSHK